MAQRKLTQAQLGTALGINQSTVSLKLRGLVGITVTELVTIGAVLGIDPGELMPSTHTHPRETVTVSIPARAPTTVPVVPTRTSGAGTPARASQMMPPRQSNRARSKPATVRTISRVGLAS